MSGETLFMLIMLFIVLGSYFLRNWHDGAHLRKYILCLVRQRDARWFDYQFQNCTQDQLLFPLSTHQLQMLRTCKQLSVVQADVIPLHNISRLWRITCFHIRYHLSGTDAAGKPFTIQEEGYLKVSILFDHSLHSPIITDISCSSSSF